MKIRLLQGNPGLGFTGMIFYLGKTVHCNDLKRRPLELEISEGTDEDLQKLEAAGFIVEKVIRTGWRKWLFGE